MSDLSNPEDFAKDVIRRVNERLEQVVEQFKEQFPGTPYGHSRLPDEEFVQWFEWNVTQDPNWAAALFYAEGGKQELERYARLTGYGKLGAPAGWRPDQDGRVT